MIGFYQGKKPKIDETCFVAETAVVLGDVEIGADSSVWYGAVVRGDLNFIRIGKGCSVQDNVTLHVDRGRYSLTIGDRVTIGHNAVVHACTIGDDCLIGIGAVVLDGAVIGESSIVAAGAVVPPGMTVPPRSLAVGVPAKVRRELTGADLRKVSDNAEDYVELRRIYLEDKRQV
jgi:carbonic anhydrase/acetyltransferase-like protein (isoleucine patch superfamily)